MNYPYFIGLFPTIFVILHLTTFIIAKHNIDCNSIFVGKEMNMKLGNSRYSR